jgi:cellulose synthase/poly-beta-1,6-N-acetylglucosamine synthase-like glycosyltransferase
LKLILRGIRVYFARNVIVYDEKVENTAVFEQQRKRWISSQFFYLRKYFIQGFAGLFKGKIAFFNSAVLRNIQLPRLLNLGLLVFLTALAFIFERHLAFSPFLWAGLLMMNVVAMLLGIPGRFYSVKLLKSVMLIPSIFLKMFMLMFKLKGANKTFIHTPHGHIETQPSNAEKL